MPDPAPHRTITVAEAVEILERARFDAFKNVLEDATLDFKMTPYPLSGATPAVHEKAKRDLVEDVVRFANVDGGIVVLGVDTKKLVELRTEVATSLHPFPNERTDVPQYLDVIVERVRPRPNGILVRWYPGRDGHEGLGAVIVPPQAPELCGTFFATRTLVDETTGRTVGAYIAYLERRGAEGFAMSAEELYQTFQAGRRAGELRERLDELTELVRRLVEERTAVPPRATPPTPEPTRPRPPGPDVVDACNRRNRAIADAGLNERPTLSLVAVPGEAVDVPELFAGSRSELIQLLEHPPELRHAGFDLTVGERPIVSSGVRRALSPGSRVLELHRDGVLIFSADAKSLLAWGTSSDDQPLRLNVLALAETTYVFAALVRAVSKHLRPPAESWRYVLGLQRMEDAGKRAVLGPGSRRSADQLFPRRQRALGSPDFEYRSPPIPATTDPRIVAYRLRQELYVAFGFDADGIPYVIKLNNEVGTDPDKIIEDGRGP